MENERITLCLISPYELYSDGDSQQRILELIRDSFGAGEYERLMRIKNARRRLESIGALVCLSRLCRPCEIRRSDSGKPYFADRSNGYFSLSHSGALSAAAYSENELGMDIEVCRPSSSYKKIARLYFSDSQLDRFEKMGEAYEEFLKIWTEKEAYAKYIGTGISKMGNTEPILLTYKHYSVSYAGQSYHVCICADMPHVADPSFLTEGIGFTEIK